MRITSRSRVEGEREKIREHEGEEKYVKIEDNILNIVCSFVCRQKGAFISSCQFHMKSTLWFFPGWVSTLYAVSMGEC